jgi:NADPH:quinone reductase-like Zn-dependent oxidoreductase
MKAIRFHEYGGIDVLRYEEAPIPRPGPGEVLVAVAATAFNPVDRWFRAGAMEGVLPVRLPHTLGLDLAGTVVDHGPGVEEPTIGTEVVAFLPMTGPGAGAEYVTVAAERLVFAPATIALTDAAAIPVPALTAWQALFEHGHLVAGQRVLVNGAGGGVGGFVVQLARRAGATVIATASPRSVHAVRAAGAHHSIDYTAATIADALDAPVDLAINLVAGTREDTASLLDVIAPNGTLVSATQPGGDFPERTQRVVFFSVRSDTTQLTDLVDLLDLGQIQLDISARRPLSDTARVHKQSEDGDLRGRTLLIP